MVDGIRCPSCHGRGRVGSGRDALRTVIGSLRESEVDPKLFAEAKRLYRELSKHPETAAPSNGSAAPEKKAAVVHALGKSTHLGAWKWRAECSGCGWTSEIRGTQSAAQHEVERHVAKEAKA